MIFFLHDTKTRICSSIMITSFGDHILALLNQSYKIESKFIDILSNAICNVWRHVVYTNGHGSFHLHDALYNTIS